MPPTLSRHEGALRLKDYQSTPMISRKKQWQPGGDSVPFSTYTPMILEDPALGKNSRNKNSTQLRYPTLGEHANRLLASGINWGVEKVNLSVRVG